MNQKSKNKWDTVPNDEDAKQERKTVQILNRRLK